MNTVNNAKGFFDRCRRLEWRVNDRLDEMVRMRTLATNITANYSDQPRGGSGNQSPVERAALRLVELEQEIADAINEMVDHRRQAQAVLDNLSDDRYRDILTWRYISCWSWDRIAEAMDCERMNVWRLHGRALLEANRVLDLMPAAAVM